MSAIDETITSKMEYYDPVKYKNEIAEFVRGKRLDLDITSNMKKNYERLYRSVFAGSEESDTERFTQAAETYRSCAHHSIFAPDCEPRCPPVAKSLQTYPVDRASQSGNPSRCPHNIR